jgi:uncharacterized membrane protein HdeD (DUF308 family)
MKKNEGTADRVIRVILGIILIGLGVYFQGAWGIVAMIVLIVLGLIAIITGITGFCGLYKLLNISTTKK